MSQINLLLTSLGMYISQHDVLILQNVSYIYFKVV